MSDVELASSLAGNLITRTVPLDWPVLTSQESQQACMRYRYRLRKVVGDDDQPDPLTSFHQREQREQGFTVIREALEQVLALLFADPVAITGRLSLESDRVLSSGVSYPRLVLTRSRPLRRLDIDASTVDELTKVWNQLRRPKLHKAIKVAVRRLAYQAGRERVEDEILDILVAAEALYLSGRDGPTELGFRLALRAAALADPSKVGMSRRDVYGTMKNAYGVRSKIVHGDQPRPTDLKVRGVPVSLQAFVQAIEDIVRPALRDAVERAAGPKLTWPPNWDDLTVPR